MATPERPWSVTVRLDDIPESGRHLDLEASEVTRAALAVPAGVDAVERLTAAFDLTRRGHDGLHVTGRVNATVRQICVVTLEPIINEIEETIEVDFAPADDIAPAGMGDRDTHLVRAADDPEPLVGGVVDLGLLATEFLVLGVDPYPRRAGAAFAAADAADAADADNAANPFAALAGWKKKDTVKE